MRWRDVFVIAAIAFIAMSLLTLLATRAMSGSPARTQVGHTEPEPIPRSMADRCKYFLVGVSRDDDVLNVVTRQDCPTFGRFFERIEVNCADGRFRYLGEGKTLSRISNDPSDWTGLVQGSAKSDIVGFVCAKDASGEYLPDKPPPARPNRKAEEAAFLLRRVADATRNPCSREYSDLYFRGSGTSWTLFSNRYPGYALLGSSSRELMAELEVMRQRFGSSKISWLNFSRWARLCR